MAVTRPRRWVLRAVLLLGLCLALVVAFADSILVHYAASYKPQVETLLSEQLGGQATIGLLQAQIDPFPRFSATDISLKASAFSAETIKISEAVVYPRLLPLFSRRLVLSQVEIRVPEFQLGNAANQSTIRDLELRAEISLDRSVVDLKQLVLTAKLDTVPLSLSSQAAHFDRQTGDLALAGISLQQGASAAAISGSINFPDQKIDLKIPNFSINSELANLLIKQVFPSRKHSFSSGEISGSLNCVGGLRDQLQIKGELSLKSVAGALDFSVAAVRLNPFAIDLDQGDLASAKAGLLITDLQFKGGQDQYQAGLVKGSLALTRAVTGAASINGDLDFQGFGYTDGLTTLKDVTAVLQQIELVSTAKGDISAKVKVNGSSLQLNSDWIKVSQAPNVSAPIVVSVPARGGYKVTGPVSVEGAEIELAGHLLQNVRGKTEMLISAPEKSFSSEHLQFTKNNLLGKISANFKMFPQEFRLISAETDYFAGLLNLSGKLGRLGAKQFSAELSAKNLELSRVKSFLVPASTDSDSGIIDNFSLNLQGNRNSGLASLVGAGEVRVTHPVAEKAGIGKQIFGALSHLPVVGQIVNAISRSQSEESLTITSKLRLGDSACYFDQAQLLRKSYQVNAEGKIGFDKVIRMKGEVIFLRERISPLGLLESLFAGLGKIVVPIFIRGTLPDYRVEADLVSFVKNNSGIQFGQDLLTGGNKK